MLFDGLEGCGLLWCFYQLFGLPFGRHPFTAEDQLVSKWYNAEFLQICSQLIYILDGLIVTTFAANFHFCVNYSFTSFQPDQILCQRFLTLWLILQFNSSLWKWKVKLSALHCIVGYKIPFSEICCILHILANVVDQVLYAYKIYILQKYYSMCSIIDW